MTIYRKFKLSPKGLAATALYKLARSSWLGGMQRQVLRAVESDPPYEPLAHPVRIELSVDRPGRGDQPGTPLFPSRDRGTLTRDAIERRLAHHGC